MFLLPWTGSWKSPSPILKWKTRLNKTLQKLPWSVNKIFHHVGLSLPPSIWIEGITKDQQKCISRLLVLFFSSNKHKLLQQSINILEVRIETV